MRQAACRVGFGTRAPAARLNASVSRTGPQLSHAKTQEFQRPIARHGPSSGHVPAPEVENAERTFVANREYAEHECPRTDRPELNVDRVAENDMRASQCIRFVVRKPAHQGGRGSRGVIS